MKTNFISLTALIKSRKSNKIEWRFNSFQWKLPIKIVHTLFRFWYGYIIANNPNCFSVSKQKLLWMFARLNPESDYLIENIIPYRKKVKLSEWLLLILLRKKRKLLKLLPYLHRFNIKHPRKIFLLFLSHIPLESLALYLDAFNGLNIQDAKVFIKKWLHMEIFSSLSSFNIVTRKFIVKYFKNQMLC